MKLSNTIFLLFLILKGSFFAQNIDYQFRHLTVDKGLTHTDATCIAQDTNGFIWIGTYYGLNRFDGYEINSYAIENDSPQKVYRNRINAMCADDKNRLWLATQGGIECFDITTERFLALKYPNTPNKENFEVNTLHYSPNGQLLIGNKEGLTVFQVEEGNVLRNVSIPNHLGHFLCYRIKRDKDQNFWLGTSKGLFFLSKDLTKLKKISLFDQNGRNYQPVSDIHFADSNRVLLSTGEEVLEAHLPEIKTNLNKLKVKPFGFMSLFLKAHSQKNIPDLSKVSVNSVVEDRKGSVWLSTDVGLLQYNPGVQDSLNFYYGAYPRSRYNLTSNHINKLFVDYSNCLWISTFGGGVNYIDLQQKKFHLLQPKIGDTKQTLSGNYIRAIQEDAKGNVWIGTREHGISYYDLKTKQFNHFQYRPNVSNGLNSNNIRSLAYGPNGKLWIGTSDNGINIYDPSKNQFTYLKHQPEDPNSLSNNTIFSIAKDKFGQMWAGSWHNGLNRIQQTNNKEYKIEQIFAEDDPSKIGISSNRITFIYTDSIYPEVFIGTNQGLDRIFLKQDGSIKKVLHYKGKNNQVNSLSSNFVWPIIRASKEVLWVGTIGGGLNKLVINDNNNDYEAKHYSIADGAPFTDIESILMDEKGRIWMGTKGISMFDPYREQFSNFDLNDGLQSNSFKIGASYKGASGRLYFGGTRGINFFYPDSIKLDLLKPKVVLTDLIVNNVSVELEENPNNRGILYQSINETDQIKLNYLENNFSISFASPYFANPGRCRYRYMLEGYDDHWIYTDAQNRKATYSNLKFGDYLFKVSASNGDGIWSEDITSLHVRILTPWWRSYLAYAAYSLLFLSVLGGIYFALIRWYKLKQAYEITLLEEKKIEEFYKMRLQFFTNISHDFKTPLSLILNPLENLINGNVGERKAKRYFHLMYNNAKRLLHLVNELINFRKVETGAYKLAVKQSNIAEVVQQLVDCFQNHASTSDICLTFKNYCHYNSCYFDQGIIEKTLSNLLGNAFKNTEKMGSVKVQLFDNLNQFKPTYQHSYSIKSEYHANSYRWLHVMDNGRGITENSLALIFDRYFSESNSNSQEMSSGIGLALVKSLVLLHRGEISVYSEIGKGTEFLIGIPDKMTDYEEVIEPATEANRPILSKVDQIVLDNKLMDLEPALEAENFKFKILIVEDNHDLRQFIKESFENQYQVFEAQDGKEGLEKARKIIPDIIISDVMMPHIDGVELCQLVKNDYTLNHIPFILLTAKSSVENNIEGVESGADYYFTKPISIRILSATIKNLVATRNKLKELYMKNAFSEARKIAVNEKEKSFMEEFVGIIENNLERTDFDIDQLCKAIGMSRTKLYNKVKSITGKSVGEFIRSLRLKRAAQILASEDISVVQVMYRVGIQSQSYFTKSFKKGFGKTPTQFVSDLSNGNINLTDLESKFEALNV